MAGGSYRGSSRPTCRDVALWYTHLAMERLIFDELEAAIDPNAAKSFRMIEQGARRVVEHPLGVIVLDHGRLPRTIPLF